MSTPDPNLIDRLDACLPQTQCTRCGYPRCRAYAEAIARGGADIDQCPPGDTATIARLADLLGVAPKPLNPAFGEHAPRRRAVIDETRCIGCRKCLVVCPVDAIVGARRWMHTVIAPACTGCELCLPPCPVDCIELVPVDPPETTDSPWPEYRLDETQEWRRRTERRLARRQERRAMREAARLGEDALRAVPPREQIRTELRAALERAKRRRSDAPK